jgi:predicted permease
MTTLRDLHFALRALRRAPGFAAAAVLVLAIGIGANTAIFSVVRAVLLKPLPYREPGRLVWVWSTRVDRDKAFYSIPNFQDTQAAARGFEQFAGFTPWGPTLSGEGEPERLSAVRVTGNAFGTLGMSPILGRTLGAADAEPEASRVAVISQGLWARRFGSDPGVLGRMLLLNGEAYAVVGVLPREFLFPGADDAEVAVPVSLTADSRRTERGSNFLRVFGRLKPGVEPSQATSELASITETLRERFPAENGKLTRPRVLRLTDEIVGGSRATLWILSGAVVLLLLVACANLAALTLVRGHGRRHEMAIRKALGASRGRLVAPVFLEAGLLAAAGAAAALVLARPAVKALLAMAPTSIPRAGDATIDAGVLAFTAAVAVACAMLCSLGPAAVAARAPAVGSLGRYGSAGAHRIGPRRAFVLAQVALSLTLLSAAGLLSKSFARLLAVNPGFAPENVLAVRATLPKTAYPDPESASRFFRNARARLESLPGVSSAGATSVLPLSAMNARMDFSVAGRPESDPSRKPGAQNRWVDPGFFSTLGIPLRRGRTFTEKDDATSPGVVIVDEALARALFAGADPVGSRLILEDAVGQPREAEIVGVVGSVKHFSLEEDAPGTLYAPIPQIPANMLSNLLNNANLVTRTSIDPLAAAPEVRRAIREVDPDVPTGSLRTMGEVRSAALAGRRFLALLFALFSIAAAALAGIGLYGTLAEMVSQERRAIGIRLALGASPSDILRHVAGRGVGLTAAGIAAGLAIAAPLSRLISTSLFGVSPTDPQAYGLAAVLLLAIAAAACALPARRASRVDPAAALRPE